MTLAEARAWLPHLRVAEANPAADRALLLKASAACEMFTPLVSLRGGDGLILDVTGCAHLFGGEEALLMLARRRLNRLGLSTRAAMAGAPEAAFALSRFSPGGVVPPGADERLARALPIAALDADAATTVALSRAGFRTLGDVADRASAALAARFGQPLATHLGRVLGREDVRITPLRSPPACMAERHFPAPMLEMPALEAVLLRLAGDVCRALEQRGQGGRRFEAAFFRADGAVRRVAVETGAPCRDAAAILRLIRLRLEALADPLDPGFGFDALRLGAIRVEDMRQAQPSLDGEAEGEGELTALVDRLVARFGRARVRAFMARDTHDPVRAGGVLPASDVRLTSWPSPETGEPPARPLTLFDPPHPIETLAEVPDGPPLRFRWRRVLHEIARAEGPERIAPEWWRDDSRLPDTRDYYRIEDAAGRRFWVFREGSYLEAGARPRWFLHGLFA